jgi:putative transposase
MTDYRRNRVPGGTYFFTVNLADRRTDLLVRHIDDLRYAVKRARAKARFHIDGWAVLPDHLHCLWTMPADDANFSYRWRAIKTEFSKRIPTGEIRSPSRTGKGERGIWQRRFWEHTIRDDQDYAVHMDYIHFNPVKHGLVSNVTQWPYSTFRRCVETGVYPPEWAGGTTDLADAGEPLASELVLMGNASLTHHSNLNFGHTHQSAEP